MSRRARGRQDRPLDCALVRSVGLTCLACRVTSPGTRGSSGLGGPWPARGLAEAEPERITLPITQRHAWAGLTMSETERKRGRERVQRRRRLSLPSSKSFQVLT